MTQSKKQIATFKNPTIAAAINALYRYESLEQAQTMLANIGAHFITAKDSTPTHLKIWVKGGSLLSEAERKQGFLGHYYIFEVGSIEGRYTVFATKQSVELKKHPEYKRQKQSHPDWGYALLREIKKNKVYKTLEDANKVLEKLHLEFPTASIPAIGKLYLMIYQKPKDANTPPVQKYVFALEAAKTGGYNIVYRLNTNQGKGAKKPAKAPNLAQKTEPKQEVGYFTSLVALRRSKKKK
jgi:hypothetical protein